MITVDDVVQNSQKMIFEFLFFLLLTCTTVVVSTLLDRLRNNHIIMGSATATSPYSFFLEQESKVCSACFLRSLTS
jgi:hypothetical protein